MAGNIGVKMITLRHKSISYLLFSRHHQGRYPLNELKGITLRLRATILSVVRTQLNLVRERRTIGLYLAMLIVSTEA